MANRIKFCRAIIISTAIVLGPLSTAGGQELYKDPDLSYQIVPPLGWKVISKGKGHVEFWAQISEQNYRPGIWIMQVPAFGKRPLSADDEKEIKASIAKHRAVFSLISEDKIDLHYATGYLVIYEHTFQALRMKTAETYVVYKGSAYLVGFNTLATTFDKYFPEYIASLKTFLPSEVEDHTLALFLEKHSQMPLWNRHFEAPDKTFDVRAQSDWTVDDKTDAVFFHPVPEDKQVSFYIVKRHKLNPSDLKEWEAETKGVFVTDSEKMGYRFSEFQETSVDSRPALKATFRKTNSDETGLVIRVFTPDIDFELYYAAPAKRYDEFLPIFEQFIQSFRVLEKK